MAPQNQEQEPAAATVRLPDFYTDSPQSWFDCINAMFAAYEVPLGVGETPLFTDRHLLPAVQGPLRLQRPLQGAAGTPPGLVRPQRRTDDE